MTTSAVPTERLRAMIRLLSPDQITPIAKRQLELLCQEYEGDTDTPVDATHPQDSR